MPFDLRDIPLDQKAEAALAARGLEYRVVDPDDRAGLEAWVAADRRGFHENRADEAELAREVSVFADRRVHAVHDPTLDAPEIPVATVASWPTGLSVPGGRSVDGWAVSSVTVAPTHRRRGVARALMEGELQNAVAAGAALAMLTASEATLYGRYGFAPAARAATVEVARRRVEWIAPLEPGRVQFVAPEVMRTAAASIARRAVARTPGEIDRWPGLIDRMLGTHAPDSERSRSIRVARYDDRHDQPQGFVVFRVKHDPGEADNDDRSVLEFDFLAAATDEAERALWRFLTEHDLIGRVRGRLRSVDEPLPWLIADRRAITVRDVVDHLWLRILDPVAALEARRYSGSGSLVLDIDDPQGYAAGRFEIEFSAKGHAEVRRSESAPTDASARAARRSRPVQGLRLGVAELGAIYLGDVAPSLLARAGRVVETTPGSLALADRLFASPRAPHLSIWF
ncbi:GNAT family N-acetyltransferase [Agromyces lapidis]|uniref:GNAT family N-acetyltransferase n=1 Tax=Agromyces lapidis TaxID=279574 RepID=A0ABV5SRW7_9MICO|nr:GNAT family N-acetyltransferase [Agromyces lapidis]